MTTLETLKAVFKDMTDGVAVIGQNHIIEFMNQSLIDDFGDGSQQKCHAVFHQNDTVCAGCRNDELFSGASFHEETLIPSTRKIFDVSSSPFSDENGRLFRLSIYRDITAKKSREQKLIGSEKDYQSLFQHVGCGVFISSKEGKFLDANPTLLQMLGYSSKEEFLTIDIANDLYVRPEERQKFRRVIERDGQVIDHEVTFRRKDGTMIPVLLTGHVRYDVQGRIAGYEGINIDLSQRKRMEKEIRENNEFLNNIIHSSPNAIMAADMKGKIILWNRAAEKILGYQTEEIVGKTNIRSIYPEGMALKIMQLLRSPSDSKPGQLNLYPVIFMRKDGKMAEGNLSAAIVYDDKQNEIATLGIFVDLKERMEMERQLKQTQDQLLQSEKLAAMGRLTSQIAHELNNPLYGIMNTLELMKTEIPPDNRRRKILEMALSETLRLSDLLHKMLTFSKPDQEIKQSTDINIILDEILTLHEKQLQENSIKIKTRLTDGVKPVFASKNQLRQVFLNMIANARDAMIDGGTLIVVTSSDDKEVKIEISDTGVGIQQEDMARIFDAFFTTKGSVKGVGLGLSVCYGFIKDHGGDIQVASPQNEGTTFTITLPAHNDPDDADTP